MNRHPSLPSPISTDFRILIRHHSSQMFEALTAEIFGIFRPGKQCSAGATVNKNRPLSWYLKTSAPRIEP